MTSQPTGAGPRHEVPAETAPAVHPAATEPIPSCPPNRDGSEDGAPACRECGEPADPLHHSTQSFIDWCIAYRESHPKYVCFSQHDHPFAWDAHETDGAE